MNSDTFRYVGVTDEQTTCDQCGRVELRRTVILALLDADGNEAERVNYGSTCAARALTARTGRRHTGPKVLAEAEWAQRERVAADREAREVLAHYELPLSGPATPQQITHAAGTFAHIHRAARWAVGADWDARVLDMLARRQAQVIA